MNNHAPKWIDPLQCNDPMTFIIYIILSNSEFASKEKQTNIISKK